MPKRFSTPGRKLSTTTSAFLMSSRNTTFPSSFLRSMTILFLLRLNVKNKPLAPLNGATDGFLPRSPVGDSTLITSAPISESI